MHRREQHPPLTPRDGIERRRVELRARWHHVQRIDHRVAGDVDVPVGNAFGDQIVARFVGGREVHIGRAGRDAAIDFFRERAREIEGA